MASQGIEHVYLQQWFVHKFGADPFLIASPTEGRVVQLPMSMEDVPAVGFKVGPSQGVSVAMGQNRTSAILPFGLEVQNVGMDIEAILPVMNRVDVILSRTRNVTWTAPDGSSLTIFGCLRDRTYNDTEVRDDEAIQILGEDWTFTVQVQLTGDVLAAS